MLSQLMLVSAAGLLLGADAPKDEAVKQELQKLKGEWEMTAMTFDGQEAPEQTLKAFRRKIDGNKYTVDIDKDGNNSKVEGTLTLDPTKKPKTVDIETDDGTKVLGIYELEGDTHKICLAPAGQDRPKDFTAPEGSRRTRIVWKRVKK